MYLRYVGIRVFRKNILRSFGRRLSFENLIHLYFQNSPAVLRCRHPADDEVVGRLTYRFWKEASQIQGASKTEAEAYL